MDYPLNDDLRAVGEAAERQFQVLAGDCRADGGQASPWEALQAQGWLTLLDDYAEGPGLPGLALVMESWGRTGLALPLAETLVARMLLTRMPGPGLFEGAERLVLAKLAEGSAVQAEGGVRITGATRPVPFLGDADAVLLPSAHGLLVIPRDAEGAVPELRVAPDGGRDGILHLRDVAAAEALAPRTDLSGLLRDAANAAMIGAAAECVGLMGAAHGQSLEHLRTRRQFGRALGSFQALQHRAADNEVALQLSRSLLFQAAKCAGQPAPARRDLALAARAPGGRGGAGGHKVLHPAARGHRLC